MQTSSLKRAHALRRANDMNGAFIAYQESAAQDNDANAHAWLSTCYLMACGTERNPQKAFEHASLSAAASNPLGKNNLGYCLQHGIGTEPDPETAFRMFQESAATGNPLAFNNLGLCFASGTGCAQDPVAAAGYFKKSAALGDSFGMNSLGNAYYTGQGVSVDFAEAFKLFVAASDKGNPTATFNLACCYLTGRGTDEDIPAAFRLFETAADGGVPAAQYRMGCMCRDGTGCEVDVDRARSYFQLAADQVFFCCPIRSIHNCFTFSHQAHPKAVFEVQKHSAFSTQSQMSPVFHKDRPSHLGLGYSKGVFEPDYATVSLSPPTNAALRSLQVGTMSQSLSAMDLNVLENIRHNRMEDTITGITVQNQELLNAASAIHKRYEAKVTSALKEFRREITELERQFSIRRLDDALQLNSLVPVQPAISLPAAGTLKSKQKGFKSRP
jgi:TPR repeat protein